MESSSNSFLEMVSFNNWANARYRETLGKIGLEKLDIQTPYGSLVDRIIHLINSIEMWLGRINGNFSIKIKSKSDFRNWDEISKEWEKFDIKLLEFVQSLKYLEDFEKIVKYVSLKNIPYESTIHKILFHLSHHQMYHRGQIAIVLRQQGLQPVPPTDGIFYFRDIEK